MRIPFNSNFILGLNDYSVVWKFFLKSVEIVASSGHDVKSC